MLVEVDDVCVGVGGGGGGDTTPGESIVPTAPGESIIPADAETAMTTVTIATAHVRRSLFTIL